MPLLVTVTVPAGTFAAGGVPGTSTGRETHLVPGRRRPDGDQALRPGGHHADGPRSGDRAGRGRAGGREAGVRGAEDRVADRRVTSGPADDGRAAGAR
ncbi:MULTISPECIES: hypothetical protein [Streptomycetaceae]|uniref:Uncharacterized protein n=1 Tax=Streptantibioticus cattleyicolor (strain ATCC 35852 / DSM 46488 / JCM 4925 / NBRC 14057 / NRRL 8057) TaxID=1003195 RepID=F8K3Y5_STREN